MTNEKKQEPHQGGKKMSAKTADFLSHIQEDHQKSREKNLPVQDKRKDARPYPHQWIHSF